MSRGFHKDSQSQTIWETRKFSLVNIHKVLNTQDEERHYFSNFDSDTKFVVIDNSANVNIWNCLKDFVNIKIFDESDMSKHVKTVRAGAQPLLVVGIYP